ncbi:MAG: CCA tRNA nucleotidyltransferase [Clostridia bacterium]|nr:CCA tRNA nucleotidyltransferase [Clostridia bacterium]
MHEKLKNLIPDPLLRLANACSSPLYLVGGAVRDCLAGLSPNSGKYDLDICSPMHFDEFLSIAKDCGLNAKSIFKNTGTVKLTDSEGKEYEYCSFRSDKYVRGTHVPVETFFTDDIGLDARRRDFTANAIYYDIKNEKIVDPLDGVTAIQEKRLTTVADSNKVFGEDGLRLMRLARQAACLGFTPDEECFLGAKQNAALIDDISPERIFTELNQLLFADEKYGQKDGVYRGLKLLDETGVLARIMPELTLGKGMAQRADFHKYDVLDHSLRACAYADKRVRLASLLHDVGKPLCTLRDGNSYAHPQEGAALAKSILHRLKAPKKDIQRIPALVEWHMYDLDCKTGENKLRRFFVTHLDILDDLLLLKQADFSACMDDFSIAPTVKRWTDLLQKMKAENAPLRVKDLALSGKDILELGVAENKIATVLNALLAHAAVYPADNNKARLSTLTLGLSKNL